MGEDEPDLPRILVEIKVVNSKYTTAVTALQQMKPNSTKIMKQQTQQPSEERYDVVQTIEFNESRSNKHSGKAK